MNRLNVPGHIVAINTASSLSELAEAITDLVAALDADCAMDQDLRQGVLEGIKWDELPTFGGATPPECGVYSYDQESIMYLEGWHPSIKARVEA